MRLLYLNVLYAERAARIFGRRVEINFDSNDRFGIKNGRLVRVRPVDRLNRRFFALGRDSSRDVGGVSVVVGANGTGKTSLVEVLQDVLLDSYSLDDYIVVACLSDGRKVYYCKKGVVDGAEKLGLERGDAAGSKYALQFDSLRDTVKLVYLSPHLTLKPVVSPYETECLTDLSSTGLLMSRPEFFGNARPDQVKKINPLIVYQAEQTKWVLTFSSAFASLSEKAQKKIRFPQPKGVCIGINAALLPMTQQSDSESALVKESFGRILEGKTFLIAAFYAYVACYVRDNNLTDPSSRESENARYFQQLSDFCKNKPTESEIVPFFEAVRAKFRDAAAALNCFRILKELAYAPQKDAAHPVGTLPILRMGGERMGDVLRLVDAHAECQTILDFLTFDVDPRMSSGELSFLLLWARLYHHFCDTPDFRNSCRGRFNLANPKTWPLAKNVILFLDEAETTLHPEWQRHLVRNVIWFFETFAPWVHPHIVFATHSPMLLSDVPIGNVVILRKSENTGITKVITPASIGISNTFGANIFDLYRHSFFLEGLPIGSFAREKILGVLSKIRHLRDDKGLPVEDIRLKHEDWRVVGLVGDGLLKRYFRQFPEVKRATRATADS